MGYPYNYSDSRFSWRALIYRTTERWFDIIEPTFHKLLEEVYQKHHTPKIKRILIYPIRTLQNPMNEHLNKVCPKCKWQTFSWISFEYKYCPKCKTKLKEYDLRNET